MKRDGHVMKIVAGAAATVLAGTTIAFGSTFIAYGNRITGLETSRDHVKAQLDRIESDVREVNRKLDRLLFRPVRSNSSSSDRVRDEATAP